MFFLTVMTPDLVDEDINHPEKRCPRRLTEPEKRRPRRLIKKQPIPKFTIPTQCIF